MSAQSSFCSLMWKPHPCIDLDLANLHSGAGVFVKLPRNENDSNYADDDDEHKCK